MRIKILLICIIFQFLFPHTKRNLSPHLKPRTKNENKIFKSHKCIWIDFQNGNKNKKFIIMETKFNSHQDFDSSLLHNTTIFTFVLILNSPKCLFPISSYPTKQT